MKPYPLKRKAAVRATRFCLKICDISLFLSSLLLFRYNNNNNNNHFSFLQNLYIIFISLIFNLADFRQNSIHSILHFLIDLEKNPIDIHDLERYHSEHTKYICLRPYGLYTCVTVAVENSRSTKDQRIVRGA